MHVAETYLKGAMPKYIIERRLPEPINEAGLRATAQRSAEVIQELGPGIQWVESYVTDDANYCVYIAANEAIIREHAFRGDLPADRVVQIRQVIDPTYAEA
jgi:hypothetical protein